MSKIKGENTSPELLLRKSLFRHGIRYRINYSKLAGKPDIVILKNKIAIFVDGEFWHGYKWSQKKLSIKSNRNFWIPKIERNIQRDNQNSLLLKKMGFKVFRFWQHEVEKNLESCVKKILRALN